MSNGLLLFTLGLSTGTFTGPLAAADSKLKGFVGGMIGVGAIVAGVQKVLEKGAGLKQLSDQTGETIGNLYRTQAAFKAVGLDAGSAGNTIFMLNKALGGVNDNGEPTAGVFSQIGLSIDDLKKLNAPQQLLSIGSALNKLDNSSATAAAGKIFGRYNAREFLQLSRNADEFADALRRGGTQAAIFDRFGQSFEKIEILSGQVKEKLGGVFLGIAAGIGPSLEGVLKSLNQVDFSKFGASIGTALSGIIEAFREGKLADIIGDSLKLGFDSLLAFAPGVFVRVGAALIKAFETPLTYIQAGMEYALSKAGDSVMHSGWVTAFAQIMNPLGGAAALANLSSGESFDQILAERKKDGVKFDLGSGEFDTSGMDDYGKASVKSGHQKIQGEVDALMSKLTALASHAPPPDAVKKNSGPAKESFGAIYTSSHTALEKMGFVFRGGAGGDPQIQTARNTARMATTLDKIADYMQRKNGGVFRDPFQNASSV